MNNPMFMLELKEYPKGSTCLFFLLKHFGLGLVLWTKQVTVLYRLNEGNLVASFGLPLEWPDFARDPAGKKGYRCSGGPFAFGWYRQEI